MVAGMKGKRSAKIIYIYIYIYIYMVTGTKGKRNIQTNKIIITKTRHFLRQQIIQIQEISFL